MPARSNSDIPLSVAVSIPCSTQPQDHAGHSARLQKSDQLDQGPSHTVEAVDQHLLDLAAPDGIQQRGLAGPAIHTPANRCRAVGEHLGDRPAMVGRDRLEMCDLFIR